MAFVKDNLKKTTDTNDGEPVEVIDIRLQYEVHPGQTMEDVRQRCQQRVDRLFAEMFSAEFKNMRDRLDEGEKWVQQGLFDPVQP
jgi:hypothetical protein